MCSKPPPAIQTPLTSHLCHHPSLSNNNTPKKEPQPTPNPPRFQPWPEASLHSVAHKFLDECDLGDDATRAAVVEFMPFGFAAVNKVRTLRVGAARCLWRLVGSLGWLRF